LMDVGSEFSTFAQEYYHGSAIEQRL